MKTKSGFVIRALLCAVLPMFFLAGGAAPMHAQATPATLHGHVNDASGVNLKKGEVKLSTDKTSEEKDRKYKFSFPIDATGNYVGKDIVPGDYLAVVYFDGKSIDFQNVSLKLGEDRALDFDMTRAEFMKALSPAERAAIEENKKKNAAALADNAKVANINATLKQAREDERSGKADEAAKTLSDLATQRPTEPLLWGALGEAQLAAADAAAVKARAAKTPINDPAILQKYNDAATSYQKAIDVNTTAKKLKPEDLAIEYRSLGSSLVKAGKLKEGADAYDMSAKTDPVGAGAAYFNEAANLYNADKKEEAAAAADKAIAADPKKGDAYYIKAASLVGKASMDPKTNKFVLPPGCLESYQEYLELEPTGSHATEVKELLTNLGQPVKNTYRAGKK